MYKFIIKTFDQLKNDNFDQVKFDQVIIPPLGGKQTVFLVAWRCQQPTPTKTDTKTFLMTAEKELKGSKFGIGILRSFDRTVKILAHLSRLFETFDMLGRGCRESQQVGQDLDCYFI
jgi:hypothetical protein